MSANNGYFGSSSDWWQQPTTGNAGSSSTASGGGYAVPAPSYGLGVYSAGNRSAVPGSSSDNGGYAAPPTGDGLGPPVPSTNPTAHPWWGQAGYNPSDPLRSLDALTKAYYTNENPGAYWQQVANQQAGGNQNWSDYYQRHFSQYMAEYLKAAEQNQNLQFPDWVTGNVANQVNQGFQLQAPELRNLDYRRTDAGRFNAGY